MPFVALARRDDPHACADRQPPHVGGDDAALGVDARSRRAAIAVSGGGHPQRRYLRRSARSGRERPRRAARRNDRRRNHRARRRRHEGSARPASPSAPSCRRPRPARFRSSSCAAASRRSPHSKLRHKSAVSGFRRTASGRGGWRSHSGTRNPLGGRPFRSAATFEPRDRDRAKTGPQALRMASAMSTRSAQRQTPSVEQSAHRCSTNPNRRRIDSSSPEGLFCHAAKGSAERNGRPPSRA